MNHPQYSHFRPTGRGKSPSSVVPFRDDVCRGLISIYRQNHVYMLVSSRLGLLGDSWESKETVPLLLVLYPDGSVGNLASKGFSGGGWGGRGYPLGWLAAADVLKKRFDTRWLSDSFHCNLLGAAAAFRSPPSAPPTLPPRCSRMQPPSCPFGTRSSPWTAAAPRVDGPRSCRAREWRAAVRTSDSRAAGVSVRSPPQPPGRGRTATATSPPHPPP